MDTTTSQISSLPSLHVVQDQDDEGLFQLVDDVIIEHICSDMIQDGRYGDVIQLIKTNSRLRRVCQGLINQEKHRLCDQRPSFVNRYGKQEWYDREGRLHRDFDLPAQIQGQLVQKWYQHGQLHRLGDKPAVSHHELFQEWWVHGQRHRGGNLPAIDHNNKQREWWFNGQLHRDGNLDLPAIEHADGGLEWYINGQRHRGGNLPALPVCRPFSCRRRSALPQDRLARGRTRSAACRPILRRRCASRRG